MTRPEDSAGPKAGPRPGTPHDTPHGGPGDPRAPRSAGPASRGRSFGRPSPGDAPPRAPLPGDTPADGAPGNEASCGADTDPARAGLSPPAPPASAGPASPGAAPPGAPLPHDTSGDTSAPPASAGPASPASPGDALPGPLPAPLPGSGRLARLAAGARAYAEGAVSDNTARAYAADWRDYARWCRRHGAAPLPPAPQAIGLYLTDLASPGRRQGGLSVASLERRLSGLAWTCARAGQPLDRQDPHIAAVLAGIRRRHARPPLQKDALSPDDLRAMLATLPRDLRGLRDRAMLLVGFAGGLRRSELAGLDRRREDLDAGPGSGDGSGDGDGGRGDGASRTGTGGGTGWAEISPKGLLLTLRGKTGWREVEIGRGAAPDTCPVAALETWLRFARIDAGPLFRRISRCGTRPLPARLSAQHTALLVKRTADAAGLRADLPEAARRALFSAHSLRAGLASHAEAPEAQIQKHLGHASAQMTRRYQRRRDRFRVNLTKAVGL